MELTRAARLRLSTAYAYADAKTRAKLVVGRLLFPRSSARWLNYVQHSDILSSLIQCLPLTTTKIYRPYLSRQLRCADRVNVLIDHYDFLNRAGLADLTRRAAAVDVELACLACKSGAVARVMLSALHEGHREGELCLKLRYQGEPIFSLSCVVMMAKGEPQLMIGRLQGSAGADARDLVRDVTRDLHGARPGRLLVALARHVAARLGCVRVLLVSNENRIAINWWRRRHISADYDRQWLELGAKRCHDGNFELAPLPNAVVDIAALPSKKRAEARRKLALMEELFVTAGAFFSRAPAA